MKLDLRILHLESNAVDAKLVAEVLEKGLVEHTYRLAGSRKEFESSFTSFQPDVVITSHSSPDIDAGNVLRSIAYSNLHIPVIVLTNPVSEAFAVRMMKWGAADYILKEKIEDLPKAIVEAVQAKKHVKTRQEEIFKNNIRNHQDAVLILSPTGIVDFISDRVVKETGFYSEEVRGRHFSDFCHPEDVQLVASKLQRALQKPSVPIEGCRVRVRLKNGGWRWYEGALNNLLHDPAVKGIITNFRDITDIIIAQEIVQKKEEKYRAFFENSLDAVLVSSPLGKIFAANPAASVIFKMSEQEICEAGRSLLSKNSYATFLGMIREGRETRQTTAEIEMLRKDQSRFLAEISVAFYSSASEEERCVIILRDISERKKLEQDLASSRESYEKLFRYSPLPNWIYDQHTLKIKDVNEAAIIQYGFSREEFLSMTIMDIRPEEEVQRLQVDLEETKNAEGVVRYGKFIHRKKDGSLMSAEVYGYRMKYFGADCRLVVCIDVTEKEEVLQDLRDTGRKLLTAQGIAKLGYWEQDLLSDRLFWTGEVYRIWGRKQGEFDPTIQNLYQTIHPEDLDYFKKEQAEALAGLKEIDIEFRIVLPDDSIKWINGRGKLFYDEQTHKAVYEGTVQDITERKVYLEKLRISESRHKGLIESQTNYLTRIDLQGRYS